MSSLSAIPTADSSVSNTSRSHSPRRSSSPYRARSSESLRPHFTFPERQPSLGRKPDFPPALSHLPTTESEFESLPPAIRRKYFSTLERLRFAHHVPPPQPPQKSFHFPKPSAPPRLLVDTLAANAALRPSHSLMGKSRKVKRASITQADAQWYLSLPEQIRRKRFTREEQVMLAGRCESVILDATDVALYRLGRQGNRSSSHVEKALKVSDHSRGSSVVSRQTRSSSRSGQEDMSGSTEPEVESPEEDWFRWMEDDDDYEGQTGPDSYHANILPDDTVPPLPENGHARRPSFRRGPSVDLKPFVPLSIPPEATNATMIPRKEPSAAVQPPKPSLNISNSAVRPNAKAAALTGDPEATYYQDPEARLKLRMYLGSAQKFDEALEFGFPSIDGANVEISRHARAAQAQADKRTSVTGNNGAQTFLNDDDDAFLFDSDSDDDDDNSSVPDDEEQPPTPSGIDITFRCAPQHSRRSESPTNLHPYSYDSFSAVPEKVFPSRSTNKPMLEPYAHVLAGGREMTLRMTLTRPELRTEDEPLNVNATNAAVKSAAAAPGLVTREKTDPLALEELPPLTDDASGTFGPFGGADGLGGGAGAGAGTFSQRDEGKGGMLKKIWKKVKGGGSGGSK